MPTANCALEVMSQPPILQTPPPQAEIDCVTATSSDRVHQRPCKRRSRWLSAGLLAWLLGPSTILLLAAVLQIGDRRQVVVPGVEVPLPEACGLYTRFGIDCPGCGLTRCFIHNTHGRFYEAWRLSPVGSLVYLFVVCQFPLAAAHVYCHGRDLEVPKTLARLTRWNEWALVTIVAMLIGQWVLKLTLGGLA
jgi:hypothetical protein